MADRLDEQWRVIVRFPNYEVSDLGRVRRRETKRILKLILRDGHGKYLVAPLSAYPKIHQRPVHQLVAHAFLGPQAKGIEVRHLDGVPTNNRLANLAYGTKADNIADAKRHGTFPLLEDRPGAKLTRKQASDIYTSADPAVVLAARYGVGPGVVRQIKTRETWRSVTEGLPPPAWDFRHKPSAETLAVVFDRTLPRDEVIRRTGLSLSQVKYLRKRYGPRPVPFADRLGSEQWAVILAPDISPGVAASRAGVSRSYVETQRRLAGIKHSTVPVQGTTRTPLVATADRNAPLPAPANRHEPLPLRKHRYGVKLTREQVVAIYTTSEPAAVLAERFSVNTSMIQRIKTGNAWRSVTDGLPPPAWESRSKPSPETLTIACDRSLSRDEVMRRTGLSFHQVEYLREHHAPPPVSFADRLSPEQWAIIRDLSIGPTEAARRTGVSLSYVKTQRRRARSEHVCPLPDQGRIKLTRQQAAAIYMSADPITVLAERFDVKASVIRRIRTRGAWRSATERLPPPPGQFEPSSPDIACDRSVPRAEVMRRTGMSLHQVEYMRQRHAAPPVRFADRLSAEQWAIILDFGIRSADAARRARVSLAYVKGQRRAARDAVGR